MIIKEDKANIQCGSRAPRSRSGRARTFVCTRTTLFLVPEGRAKTRGCEGLLVGIRLASCALAAGDELGQFNGPAGCGRTGSDRFVQRAMRPICASQTDVHLWAYSRRVFSFIFECKKGMQSKVDDCKLVKMPGN